MQNEDRILSGFALEAGASEVRAAYQSEIKRLQQAAQAYAVATAKLELMHDEGASIMNDMRRDGVRQQRRFDRWRRQSAKRRREFEHLTYWTMVGLVCLALVLGWSLHAIFVRRMTSSPPAAAVKKATTAVAPPTN